MATPSHPNIRTMTLSGANTNRPFTIVVEGNIGSGKTTFLNEFKDMENELEIMPEPVDKWRNCQGIVIIL